MVIYIYKVFS